MTTIVDGRGGDVNQVVIGVDTHQEKHVDVGIDRLDARLGELHAAATTHGYEKLERWLWELREIHAFGIEGTASDGAGVTRHMTGRGYSVIKMNRHDRSTR